MLVYVRRRSRKEDEQSADVNQVFNICLFIYVTDFRCDTDVCDVVLTPVAGHSIA